MLYTLPGTSDLGSMPPTSPWVCRAARYRGDWSCCCRRVPQTAPESLFILGKILLLNPVAPSIPGRACLLTQPSLQLDQDCPNQDPTQPNSQLSPASAHSLRGFTTSSLFPSCDFKQPGVSRCYSSLVWQGRELLTRLSPRSPAAGCSHPGA